MGWTDWIVSIALIALVLRQVRGRRLTWPGLLWPVGLVGWAVVEYGRTVPPTTGDAALVVVLALVGVVLGTTSGALTRVDARGSDVVAQAGVAAAALWVVGVGARLGFGLVAEHSGGAVVRWSADLRLASPAVWGPALVCMALLEVLSRTAVLGVRLVRARRSRSPGTTEELSRVRRSPPRAAVRRRR